MSRLFKTNPISNPAFEGLTQMIEISGLRDVASIGEVKFIKAECWKRIGRRLFPFPLLLFTLRLTNALSLVSFADFA